MANESRRQPQIDNDNPSQRRPQGDDTKGERLDDGWDADEVAKMKLGASRHNHTAEPVTDALQQVHEDKSDQDVPERRE